jgi:hypothetical protein
MNLFRHVALYVGLASEISISNAFIKQAPREILKGGTRLLWGFGDRLRLYSKLRF